MITNKNEAKTMKKHVSCDFKSKFSSTKCNSNQKWNDKICQCERKNYHKIIVGILTHVFVRIANI